MGIVVFVAHRIVMMDDARPIATAVGNDGDRIIAVGSLDEVREAIGATPYVLDESFADLGSIEVGKIENFTVVDRNPLDVEPMELHGVTVVGTVFCGRWFPLPIDACETAARRPVALQLVVGSEDRSSHEHTECICDVAREIMRAIA